MFGLSIKSYATAGLVIVLAVVSLLWQLEKAQHKATASEYATFIANQEKIVAESKAKNAIDSKNFQTRITALELEAVKRDIDRDKLKGKLNEQINSNTILRNAMRLRNNQSASSGGVSVVPQYSIVLTDTERTCNEAVSTVIDAAVATHYDYTDLYNAWQGVCNTYGCE